MDGCLTFTVRAHHPKARVSPHTFLRAPQTATDTVNHMIRTLARDETPQPGDLLFSTGPSLVSYAIRLGQLDGLSHVGVIVDTDGTTLTLLEALAPGVVYNQRTIADIDGYFVRVGDSTVRAMVVAQAVVAADQHLTYSWATIGWQAGRMLRTSAARWLGVTIVVGAALQQVTARRAADDRHVICSEFAVNVLRDACGTLRDAGDTSANHLGHNLTPLHAAPGWQVSPIDLFRVLLGRRP